MLFLDESHCSPMASVYYRTLANAVLPVLAPAVQEQAGLSANGICSCSDWNKPIFFCFELVMETK